MQTESRLVKEVVLASGEYHIAELVFGLDFIVVDRGELEGKTFPLWGGYYSIDYGEHVPLTLVYEESRSWRTMWRWQSSIAVSDGQRMAPVTEQAPRDITTRIEVYGAPASTRRLRL